MSLLYNVVKEYMPFSKNMCIVSVKKSNSFWYIDIIYWITDCVDILIDAKNFP